MGISASAALRESQRVDHGDARTQARDQLTTASAISAWRGASSPITTVHTNTLAGSCSEYCPVRIKANKKRI
jgi:hypothetical protein